MNEQAIRFRLGIFVLSALILLAVMITLFGGFPNYFKKADTYTLVFKDAQGIAAGTPVRRSGVRIGEVRKLTLDNATNNVNVLIQVDHGFSIRKTDKPTIVSGLLGGDTAIAFLPPPENEKGDAALVPPGATLVGFNQADAQSLVQKTTEVMPEAKEAMEEIKKVFKKLDQMAPLLEETVKEYREFGKLARETMPEVKNVFPEFKKTTDELQVLSRQWTKVGERMDIILATNEDKIARALSELEDVLKRASRLLSDDNQKLVVDTLKNVEKGSRRIDTVAKETEDFLKDSRVTVKHFDELLKQSELLIDDVRKATKEIGDKSPSILKNVDESADKLNRTLTDVREIISVIGRSDGTIQRLLSDPSVYNSLNDTLTMVNRIMPRLDRAMRDVEIFADRLARHPELLGVGGALRPSSGIKETPTVYPWRLYGH